jgi:hypothetical protein
MLYVAFNVACCVVCWMFFVGFQCCDICRDTGRSTYNRPLPESKAEVVQVIESLEVLLEV